MKRNDRWPQLDLEGSLKLNAIERIPKSAASAAFSDHNPEYYAKVTFSFPFEDRSARSEYNKAKNEKAKALVTLKKAEKTTKDRKVLQQETFYGNEKKPVPALLGLINMLLHGKTK